MDEVNRHFSERKTKSRLNAQRLPSAGYAQLPQTPMLRQREYNSINAPCVPV